jgi:hypothetical protein
VAKQDIRKSTPVVKKPAAGFIAGKTDFRGLLKTAYVRLTVIRRDDPSRQFFFYVGSKGNQSVVPWGEERSVEPGYFVLEFAPGPYKITQIAIPVGSTMAEEDLELDFEVRPGKAVYVGTLDVDGTKEKVKFGGVPLIRPGFAYRLAIHDDIAEALSGLKAMLPAGIATVDKGLFTVVSAADNGIPPEGVLRPGVRKKN